MELTPFTVEISAAQRALIREVRPDDKDLLLVGFDHLSAQSRYFRFLGAHPRLSAKELEDFTATNDEKHMAVGALITNRPNEVPAGIARYVRTVDGADTAEFAVTIIDRFQGLGLGSLLLGVLAKCAVFQDVSAFVSVVHSENRAMLSLIHQLGGQCRRLGESELQFTFPLYRDAQRYPASKAGDTFRKADALVRLC